MYTPFLLKFNNLICFVLLLLSGFWIQSLNFCYQSWINAWLLNLQSWIKLWLNWWVTIVLKSSTHITFEFCRKLLVRIVVVTYNQYWSTFHFFQSVLDINAVYNFLILMTFWLHIMAAPDHFAYVVWNIPLEASLLFRGAWLSFLEEIGNLYRSVWML